jgi:hypothetical protein
LREDVHGDVTPHELDDVSHVPWLLFRLVLNTAALGVDSLDSGGGSSDDGCGGSSGSSEDGAVAGALRVGTSDGATAGEGFRERPAVSASVAVRACALAPALLRLLAAARLPAAVDEAVHCVATLAAALRRTSASPHDSAWCRAALSALDSVARDLGFALDLKDAFLGTDDVSLFASGAPLAGAVPARLPDVSALGGGALGDSAGDAAWRTLCAALGCPRDTTWERGGGGGWAAWDESTAFERRETLAAEATFVDSVLAPGVRSRVAAAAVHDAADAEAAREAAAGLQARAAECANRVRAEEAARLREVRLNARPPLSFRLRRFRFSFVWLPLFKK